ncbi:hypothetical protein SRB5_20530 [Streptomyces sp. RB5]|uniref:Uncharacterized protein n=1 Tax=Streptomyces smaragdinus TaxID=2585196 RepID=A0A7K0CEZ7_9ACTN|nr:hypothetical protein [Streptomyces smaragdinus]MQY11933.1 hypothetical protein [Streptomyces smaragdinus]
MPAQIFGRGTAPGRRHPVVALAMVLPLAALLTVAFGGWEAVALNASSVAGMMGL